MEDLNEATRPPSADWLPPDVLSELSVSAVAAIRAVRVNHGLGLYEAKQVIDAYLQQHPEHPLARRLMQAASSKPPERRQTFAEYRDALMAKSPEAGEPLSLESLPNRTRPPAYYVVARSMGEDGGQWFGKVLRACLDAVDDSACVEVVDEELGSPHGDVLGAALKLTEPLSDRMLKQLTEDLVCIGSGDISCRWVRGCGREELLVPPQDLKVEYFLQEGAHETMVWPTISCVRLTHGPTGVVARATCHRSRAANYEEALYLLASLVRDRAWRTTP